MSALDKELRRQLYSSLLEAFPDENSLHALVSLGLNERVAEVAGNDLLGDQFLRLIEWAESQDRLEELILEALQQRPNHRRLRSIAVQLGIVSNREVTYAYGPKTKSKSHSTRKTQPAHVIVRNRLGLSKAVEVYHVFIDGEKVGSLPFRQSITVEIAPGSHTINVRHQIKAFVPFLGDESEVVSFGLKAGEEVIFTCLAGEQGILLEKA